MARNKTKVADKGTTPSKRSANSVGGGDEIVAELRAEIAKAEKRGISRYAIAKAAGIGYGQIVRIAEGENIARLDTAGKIAKAMGFRLTLYPI